MLNGMSTITYKEDWTDDLPGGDLYSNQPPYTPGADIYTPHSPHTPQTPSGDMYTPHTPAADMYQTPLTPGTPSTPLAVPSTPVPSTPSSYDTPYPDHDAEEDTNWWYPNVIVTFDENFQHARLVGKFGVIRDVHENDVCRVAILDSVGNEGDIVTLNGTYLIPEKPEKKNRL